MSSSAENETHNNGGYTNRGLKKGPWSSEEDEKLKAYVYSLQAQYPTKNGVRNWKSVSKSAGLSRCGRSCRLRWKNHLDKDIKKGPFSKEEEKLFFELHAKLGGFKWSKMALQFPGRSDNAIKNFWNARKRKYKKSGLSPYPNNTRHADVLNGNNPHQLPTLFAVPNTHLPNFVADSNMLYYDVGSNHIAPTSIAVADNGASTTPMAMMSYQQPPLQECSYIPNIDYLLSLPQFSFIQTMDCPGSSQSGYSQIPSPEETQYQILESISPENDGLLESMFKTAVSGECSYAATPMRPPEINLVDERGKKPISLENDVEDGDLIDTDLWFNYGSYDNDNNNLHDKLPHNMKNTLDAVIHGKIFHK